MDPQILSRISRDKYLQALENTYTKSHRRLFLESIDIEYSGNDVISCKKVKLSESGHGQWQEEEIDKRLINNNEPRRIKARLVLGHPLGHKLGDGLPFSGRRSFEQFLESFQTPAMTAWSLVSDSTHFQKYNMEMSRLKGRGLGFTMRLYSRGVIGLNVAVSVAYHAATGAVHTFLHGCTVFEQTKIETRLLEITPLALHPLVLPVLLVEEKMCLIEKQETKQWNRIIKVEMRSQQTDYPEEKAQREPIETSDSENERDDEQNLAEYEWVTRKVLGVIQITTYAESYAKSLLLLIESIGKAVHDVDTITESPHREYMTKSGAILSERLSFLAHRTSVIISDLQFIEKRAQAQQAAVYNYISQKEAHNSGQIAMASKRDSSAMKGIAILTMVFLPGTYVATFLAMPVLDFTTDSQSRLPVLRKSFWLYWAVSMPLTIAVLIVYAIFQHYVQQKHQRQDKELQFSSPAEKSRNVEMEARQETSRAHVSSVEQKSNGRILWGVMKGRTSKGSREERSPV